MTKRSRRRWRFPEWGINVRTKEYSRNQKTLKATPPFINAVNLQTKIKARGPRELDISSEIKNKDIIIFGSALNSIERELREVSKKSHQKPSHTLRRNFIHFNHSFISFIHIPTESTSPAHLPLFVSLYSLTITRTETRQVCRNNGLNSKFTFKSNLTATWTQLQLTNLSDICKFLLKLRKV